MRKEIRDDVDKSLKSLITEIIIKAHSNEIKIPEAVEKIIKLMKTDVVEKERKTELSKTVDPLFEKGPLPLNELSYCEIQKIKQTENGNYKYFIHNKYNSYGSGWITEDDLIKKLVNAKENNSKNL